MVKRRKGKGKGRKHKSAMTRRSPDTKYSPSAGDTHRDADAESQDAEAEKTSGESASPPPEEGDAQSMASSDDRAPQSERDSDSAPDSQAASEDGAAADSEPPPSKPTPSRSGDEDEEEPESLIGLPTGAPWAVPLVKFEHRWTWLEVRMMFGALIALMLVLVFWASMGSMADSLESAVPKGGLFRMIVGASALGLVARLATRNRLDEEKRKWVTTAAVVVGVATAGYWRANGIQFFDGLNDWLQKGSVFALFGGLKGVSTRLTMFVALVGGSLAAASGTHIAIDAVTRIIPKWTRRPVAIGAGCATAIICFLAAWGFMDHIAITSFGAKVDASPGQKISRVTDRMGEHFFLLRKQVRLDLGTLPHVLNSERWNDPARFTGQHWNDFMDQNGFADRYGEEAKQIRAPQSALDQGYQPFVKRPGEAAAGQLKHSLDLMWPVGFMFIGLRFLLRAVLLFAGHVKEEEIVVADDADDAATEGAA